MIARLLGLNARDLAVQRIAEKLRAGERHSEVVVGPRSGAPPQRVVVLPREDGQGCLLLVARRGAELAGVASHEVANALTVVAAWVELAKNGSADQVSNALDHIGDATAFAAAAARGVLTAQPHDSAETSVDVSEAVAHAVSMLTPLANGSGVRMGLSSAGRGALVAGSEAQVWTIVMNLVKNAIEAQPYGGRVRVAVSAGVDTVEVVVEDDGPGLDVEGGVALAFESHFTTKEQGTGLGLANVKRTVEMLGGRIAAESPRDGGARFTVQLPRLATQVREEPPSRPSGVLPGRRAVLHGTRVLLVDDDAALRGALGLALEMHGALVACAGGAADGLAMGRAATDTFDVALVDLRLGDARGDDVVARLRASSVARAIVLMTGGEPPQTIAEGGHPDAWLRKPFDLSELLALVEKLGAGTALAATQA